MKGDKILMSKNRAVSLNFGCMIKYLREQRNLTLEDLSKSTGISKSYISRLEVSQRKAPTIPVVKVLADGLGVEMSELLEVANIKANDIKSLSTLILSNNFIIDGQVAGGDIKEKIIAILDVIISSVWTEETMIHDVFVLCDSVNILKRELKIKMLGKEQDCK